MGTGWIFWTDGHLSLYDKEKKKKNRRESNINLKVKISYVAIKSL